MCFQYLLLGEVFAKTSKKDIKTFFETSTGVKNKRRKMVIFRNEMKSDCLLPVMCYNTVNFNVWSFVKVSSLPNIAIAIAF